MPAVKGKLCLCYAETFYTILSMSTKKDTLCQNKQLHAT